MAEELTNALTRVGRLRVIARTSAFAFKGKGVDVREIGRQLGAAVIIEGGVQKSGERLRITVQAVESAAGGHLWSERFDRTAGDIFAIEDEIARAVVAALRVKLGRGETVSFPEHHSRNEEAHDLYLRGRYLWGRRSPDAVADAIRALESAIAKDPEYPAAHAALAECYGTCGYLGFLPPKKAFPRARQAAGAAVSLDAGSAHAYAVLGLVSALYEWNWAASERWFERACEAGPSCAQARLWHATMLATTGRPGEACEEMERAFDLDPLSPVMHALLSYALMFRRDFQAAAGRCLKALEFDPDHILLNLHLGRAYIALAEYERALEPLRKASRGFPVAMSLFGGALASLGRRAEAEEVLREMKRISTERYVGPFACLSIVGGLEGDEAALDLLSQALDEREGLAATFFNDPLADRLRAHPRFQTLMARLGIPPVASQ
jgi:tetratricopeptide (TPR) repeat protein